MKLCRFLIEPVGFSLLDSDSPLRAFTEAGTQAIAICLTNKLSFAINYLKGSLNTGWNTQTAAVTLLLINSDYLPH